MRRCSWLVLVGIIALLVAQPATCVARGGLRAQGMLAAAASVARALPCLNDCSKMLGNRGECVDGVCVCKAGFGGVDCSVVLGQSTTAATVAAPAPPTAAATATTAAPVNNSEVASTTAREGGRDGTIGGGAVPGGRRPSPPHQRSPGHSCVNETCAALCFFGGACTTETTCQCNLPPEPLPLDGLASGDDNSTTPTVPHTAPASAPPPARDAERMAVTEVWRAAGAPIPGGDPCALPWEGIACDTSAWMLPLPLPPPHAMLTPVCLFSQGGTLLRLIWAAGASLAFCRPRWPSYRSSTTWR